MEVVLDEDWTLVTNNAIDFRGPELSRGAAGLRAGAELHAGLICLSCSEGMDLDLQLDLSEAALDELEMDPDLVNKVLEIHADARGADELTTRRYDPP